MKNRKQGLELLRLYSFFAHESRNCYLIYPLFFIQKMKLAFFCIILQYNLDQYIRKMKPLVSNFYMIDLLLWMALFTGYFEKVHANCGSESIAVSNTGQQGHTENIYVNAASSYTISYNDLSGYFDLNDPTGGTCSTITYSLLNSQGTGAYTGSDFTIDANNNQMTVVRTTAFATQTIKIQAQTPGGSNAQVPMYIGVMNSGCTYSQTGATTYTFPINPTSTTAFNWVSEFPCQYSSDNTADTDCPTTKRLIFASTNGNTVAMVQDQVDESVPANSFQTGASMTLYYSVGLAGNPFNQEALAKSTICAVTIIGCGNEAIALAAQGTETLTETQGNAGDTNVMNINALDGYFSLDHTANQAYSDCGIVTYQLLDTSGNVLGDTSVISYDASTGLTIKLENTQSNYGFKLKATTDGGKEATKTFDLSINAQGNQGGNGCGSESIQASTLAQSGFTWGMYASAGQTADFDATLSASMYNVQNAANGCDTLTYTLFQTDQTSQWSDTKITLSGATGRMSIDYGTAFGTKTLMMKGTTGGGQSVLVTINIVVLTQGCTYSAGATVNSQFHNPLAQISIDPTAQACDFTTSDSAATACPLSYLMFFQAATDANFGQVSAYATMTVPANTFSAGQTTVQNIAVGIPAQSPAVLLKSPVCVDTLYMCGKETIAIASSGTETVKQPLAASGTYVLTNANIDALFQVDSSAADAYSGCAINQYELVQASGAALTDTSKMEVGGTGVTFKLDNAFANYQDAYIKVTTIGQKTASKQLDYTVIQCGAESIAGASFAQPGVYYGLYVDANKKILYDDVTSAAFFDVSNLPDAVCGTLTYTLKDFASGNNAYTDAAGKITLEGGYLQIDYGTAFGTKQFRVTATTPGAKEMQVSWTVLVMNSGCSYTLGSKTSQDLFLDSTIDNSIDYSGYDCQWTSSNTASDQCPLTYSLYYDSAAGTDGQINQYADTTSAQTLPANTYSSGGTFTHYRAMGLPGYSKDKKHLTRGGVCTEKYYFCGKETVTLANSNAEEVKRAQHATDTYIQDENTLAAFFTIDSSAADAYSGCVAKEYELVLSDGQQPYTDTTYVSYASGTGLTWKLAAIVNAQDVYLKMTTIGGKTQVKQLQLTVFACGSESIAQANGQYGNEHYEAIYATGNNGDTYTISAADILSNYFTITDSTGNCVYTTNTLVDKTSGNAWTDSKISVDSSYNLVIDIKDAFAAKTFDLKATTPGGSAAQITFVIMVTNSGCTYSHSGATSANQYEDPTAIITDDKTKLDCKYTSTNTADTECPLYIMYYDAGGNKYNQGVGKYDATTQVPANQFSADSMQGPTNFKVGLPGNPFNSAALAVASQACAWTLYMCGKETVTEQTAGDQVLSYASKTQSGSKETTALSVFETWFKYDTSAFTAGAGRDWSGCGKAKSYALLQTDGGNAYTDAAKASFDATNNILSVVVDTVVSHNMYLEATTIGGKKFSKKLQVDVAAGCGTLTWTYTSTPAMTNTLTVGAKTYKIYEKAVAIGASNTKAEVEISKDVVFSNDKIGSCAIATWTLKESLTAQASLASGSASQAAKYEYETFKPSIKTWYYTVSTADPTSDTIVYKLAICGLEKVAVSDTSEVKITKYYNEFKKDYATKKYYAESIYSTWFSIKTDTLVSEKLVADTKEADIFKNGCPINDYMLCKDEECKDLHKETSLFYFEYQTKTQITNDGTLQANGKEPGTRRLQAPQGVAVPYGDPSFNITKVSVRDTTEKYSRIVMKTDTVYSQSAYLSALTTGYAKGIRQITFENKCGLEYIYPQKASYDLQLQIDNGFFTMQASEYGGYFKNSFSVACPIVKYEIRSYDKDVTVDDKLADGTYLKFTEEYLKAEGVTDPIPQIAEANQKVQNAAGAMVKYTYCQNSLTDEGVACTSPAQGGKVLDLNTAAEDDILRRVEILSTGFLQINTDKVVLDADAAKNVYPFDIVAISEGGAEGFAHMKLEFIAKRVPANNLPEFASKPGALTIDVVDLTTIQTYNSPKASDADGDSMTITVSGNIYSFITIKTSDTGFTITVDHSQITESLDGKSFTLSVELTDSKDTVKYSVSGKINWKIVVPEPVIVEEVVEEDVAVVEEEQQVELQEGEVEIAPETAEWQDVASADTMNALFAEVEIPEPFVPQNETDEDYEPPPPPPKISSENVVSRDGQFGIGFDQLMKVPDFIDTGSSAPREERLLQKATTKKPELTGNETVVKVKVPLSQLDVLRDICSVRFILASEIDPKDIKFFLQITRWDPYGIDIFVNFTNPMMISRGEDRDLIEITIKRPQLFKSAETGRQMDTSDLVFYQTIPRQLPKGISEKSLKDDAEEIARILNSMAYIQIGLQFMLKGIMADLMVTFYCLQICCFFTIYKVNIPGNSEIYIDEFRKLIDMDAVKPDNILKQFNKKWSVDYFMNLSKQRVSSAVESSGMKSTSFVKNMSTFLFIGAGCLGGLVVMALCTVLKSRFQAMIKEKLNGTLNKMFFNGQIKGMTVSYLKTTIAFSASVQFMDFEGMSAGELWAALGAPVFLCCIYPFLCLFVVLKCRAHLGKARFKKRISNMYEGVAITKNQGAVLFYPLYLIRRLGFVCLPLLLYFNSTLQIQVLFFMNYAYSIYFFWFQPIADPVKNKMQMYNEMMMLGITYHMFYFTDFCQMDKQFTMGYSFVFTLVAILMVNVIKMAHNSMMQSLSARRKAANQKAYEKAFNDWVDFQVAGKKNRKGDREKKRLEKLERAEKAMKAFKSSALVMNLKKDIDKRKKLAALKEKEAAKKAAGALDQLFSQTSKGNGLDLLAPKPKIRSNSKANLLKLSLDKKLDLTQVQEQEGEEGTQRTAKNIYDAKETHRDIAKKEFDLAFQKLFEKDDDSETEVELTEEEIELNKLIASLSFLDRATYRKNADLVKKYNQMDEQIQEKRRGSKLSLKETIDLLDGINQEYKGILPLEAIHLQHKKKIGGAEPQEQASPHKETPDEQYDIYLTAISIEIEQIKGQQDRIERRNKVGKYQHLKKQKKEKVQENVIDLDAIDQELALGAPLPVEEEDEVNFDIELPDRLQRKRQNRILQEKETTTGADDLMVGAVIVGAHSVIPLTDQQLDAMKANQNDNKIRIVDPDEDVEVHEEISQSKFKYFQAKAKYLGASGLVFAGILENEDLPPDPDEEEKDEDEEEKVEEEEEDEDEDSASDESGDEEEGDGKGKKKKKGVVEEEEEEELPEDY